MSGSSNYVPDGSAILSGTLYTALLSQRDVSLRVPINYVTAPGVTLTSACFSDNHYEDGPAQNCFSNLLAVGVRRFVIDLYWDTSRLTWSFCRVELGSGGAVATPTTSPGLLASLTASPAATTRTATLSGGILPSTGGEERRQSDVATATSSEGPFDDVPAVRPRQTVDASETTTSSLASSSVDASVSLSASNSSSSSNGNANNQPTPLPNSGGTLFQLGPYTCSSSLGLDAIINALASHLEETENSLNATLKYLILNLHAAAPSADPTGVPPTPKDSLLPDFGNYLGQLLNSSLSTYIFTPPALSNQRANLNQSWFNVEYAYRPLTEYFDSETNADGTLSSVSGWPSESYVELRQAFRFLAGFGTIDPQLQGYDFDADTDTIFPAGYISDPVGVTVSAAGVVTGGCLFQPNTTELLAVNSSWAVAGASIAATDPNILFTAAGNLTSCGISPILNVSLGSTAAQNMTLYRDYVRRDLWSWAYNEPRNTSGSSQNLRCAAVNFTNGGKWQVADCTGAHYGACRVGQDPYMFTITSQSGSYDKMDDACGDDNFTVPATALENTYLNSAIRDWIPTHDDDDGSMLFWINFNDLDVRGCWVNGVNSSCPYVRMDTDRTRTVVVPVVAAVIIFVLFFLTLFVKCAANRQNSKRRRRRGDRGWDYEGVPS